MITVSPLAEEKLSAYLSENKVDSPVRITVMNGCGGMSLALALDGKKETDHVSEKEGFTLLIAQELAEECGNVTVDYVEKTLGSEEGFSLTSEKPLPVGGGGCGGSCSSGGCGC